MDSIFHQDLIDSISDSSKKLEFFSGKTFFISGITGLVGHQFAMTILYMNKYLGTNCRIIGLARNKEKFESLYSEYESLGIEGVFQDIVEPLKCNQEIDYFLHAAATTKSSSIIKNPINTFLDMIEGTKNVLELACKNKNSRTIYLSSMEVYGQFDHYTVVNEESLGYLDLTNVRNVYPEGKRACELLCASYYKEYGIDTMVARLAQTFGSGVDLNDGRFFSQLAKSVINKEDITLNTEGNSIANYCNSRDVVRALLLLFNCGEPSNIYNISNPNSTDSIKNVANMVCREIALNQIELKYQILQKQNSKYAEDTQIKLDIKKIVDLGWQPEISLQESFEKLIFSMAERMK